VYLTISLHFSNLLCITVVVGLAGQVFFSQSINKYERENQSTTWQELF